MRFAALCLACCPAVAAFVGPGTPPLHPYGHASLFGQVSSGKTKQRDMNARMHASPTPSAPRHHQRLRRRRKSASSQPPLRHPSLPSTHRSPLATPDTPAATAAAAPATRRGMLVSALGFSLACLGGTLAPATTTAAALPSDEFEVVFKEAALGIELDELMLQDSSRVVIKRVIPGGEAETKREIRPNLVVVTVDGKPVERLSGPQVKAAIQAAPRPLSIVFRDPGKFTQLLRSFSDKKDESGEPQVSTEVAPAVAGAGQSEQVLRVVQARPSPLCSSSGCKGGAKRGDLLEIKYQGALENGTIFDGSMVKINGKEVQGRGGDGTIYLVLGKQGAGQFPPGWDLGLVGMCPGERRVVYIPPVLGYGKNGLKRRGIPPDATLIYRVELVSVNSVYTCSG